VIQEERKRKEADAAAKLRAEKEERKRKEADAAAKLQAEKEEKQRREEIAKQKRPEDDKALDEIWNAYTNHPGNAGQGTSWINVKGRMIKQGTVPPSAVRSSVKGRLPAYLACYDYVSVQSGLGDFEEDLCIYYIDNPTRGTYAIMWRGPEYIDRLKSRMASDGFSTN
jgi:hypothetical protein